MLREDLHPLTMVAAAEPLAEAGFRQPAADDDRRILVIRHGAFGDLIQADGALRDIRTHHPTAQISMLVAPQFARLMARCPHVDEVIPDPRAPLLQLGRNFTLLRRLRTAGFDRAYDLQGSDRTRLYRRLLPNVRAWNRRHNPGTSDVPDRSAYARLLQQAGIAAAHAEKPNVAWMADDVAPLLRAAGLGPGYVVLIPGSAGRHLHKRWPHFAALARGLIAAGREVVYVPGPDELALVRGLPGRALLRADGGVLDWFQLAGVLRGAGFVVGNDTGPAHLAACLDRPGLALFGPRTNAQRTGMRHRSFDAIEAADLAQLQADRVLDEVLRRLA